MCKMYITPQNVLILILSIFVMSSQSNGAPQLDWWKNAVFYQIYPRSFMDSNDDGIGDLRGIISKLDYLAKTGITATWLSPIFESPMVDFGYDISNFYAIHHEYGTMEDFEQLIKKANELNIKIILDFVPNHSSDQCDWFRKSVDRVQGYEDFYVWADGKPTKDGEMEPPNNWVSVFYGSAWTWNEKRQQYYLHQFTVEQPDLNYRNPEVIKAMDDVLRFWLNKGVAGFRVDAVNHLYEDIKLRDEPVSGATNDSNSYGYTKKIHTRDLPEVLDMLHHWRDLLDEYPRKNGGPTRIMMTEAYTDIKGLMDYYVKSDGLEGSHIPFNFLLISDLNKDSDARDFVFNLQKWMTYMPRGYTANWVLGNHDNSRVATRFGAQSVDALNMLLMTLPGVAITYNGDEIGMQDNHDITWDETVDPPAKNAGPENYLENSRDPERTPFQWDSTRNSGFSNASKTWLPVNKNYKRLNLAKQMSAKKSHYKVYKNLVQLRESPTLQFGRFKPDVINNDVFAYKRILDDKKLHPGIIVVINVSSREYVVDLTIIGEVPQKLKVLVAGSESSHENGNIISSKEVHLLPHEGLVCTYVNDLD